jgi:peptidoglycan/xylan/chitin deacetylase (PgdA/CDA1 family)
MGIMNKREIAARILDNRVVRRLWHSSERFKKGLRILAYHRILDDRPETFPFDEGVISANSETFYQQMKFVSRHFDVISFADLYQCEKAGRLWPERALIITFDDGYRDNYTNAYPILKAFHLPATIFLATDHIGQTKLFWWDAIAYCVKQTRLSAKDFPEVSDQPLELATALGKAKAIQRILEWIKRVPDEVCRTFAERLPDELEVEIPCPVSQRMHLSWEEVKEMADNRIEFGSHTVTHPILANVCEEQLQKELCESKKTLEQRLNKEVLTLAYPAGRRAKFTRTVQQSAANYGYQYAVAYDEGIVFQERFDRYAMPRIHVETEFSERFFRASLMFPKFLIRTENQSLSPFAKKEATGLLPKMAKETES